MYRPEIHKEAQKKNMKDNTQIDGDTKREKEIGKVQGVKKSGLKTTEKGRTGKEVWVPEGQVSLFQFTESEVPPEDKMIGNIRLGGCRILFPAEKIMSANMRRSRINMTANAHGQEGDMKRLCVPEGIWRAISIWLSISLTISLIVS